MCKLLRSCFYFRVQFRRTSAPLEPKNEPVKQLEEYRALAEFNAEDGSQVSFKEGDKILVKSKDKSGTFVGRNSKLHKAAAIIITMTKSCNKHRMWFSWRFHTSCNRGWGYTY